MDTVELALARGQYILARINSVKGHSDTDRIEVFTALLSSMITVHWRETLEDDEAHQ